VDKWFATNDVGFPLEIATECDRILATYPAGEKEGSRVTAVSLNGKGLTNVQVHSVDQQRAMDTRNGDQIRRDRSVFSVTSVVVRAKAF
jgi:hypothetical protein